MARLTATEKRRLALEQFERDKQAALAKLSPEERELLGV